MVTSERDGLRLHDLSELPQLRRVNLTGTGWGGTSRCLRGLRPGCEVNLVRCAHRAEASFTLSLGTRLLFDGEPCDPLGLRTLDDTDEISLAAEDPFRGASLEEASAGACQLRYSDLHRDLLRSGIEQVRGGDPQGYERAIRMDGHNVRKAVQMLQRIVHVVADAVPTGEVAAAMLVPRGRAFELAMAAEGDRQWYVQRIAVLHLCQSQRAEILSALPDDDLGILVRQQLSSAFHAASQAAA